MALTTTAMAEAGTGKYYTDPGVVYSVTGSDPYGLDGNQNGLGCE